MSFEDKVRESIAERDHLGGGQIYRHGDPTCAGNASSTLRQAVHRDRGDYEQTRTGVSIPSVSDAILMRELKLTSELEALRQLRRSLSIDVLEGPITRLQPIFDLKPL
jgi:hypothetical protein